MREKLGVTFDMKKAQAVRLSETPAVLTLASPKQRSFSPVRWVVVPVIAALAGASLATVMIGRRNVEQRSGEYNEKGAAFGALTDQAGCMQEGFLRSRSATGSEINEFGLNASFTAACLRSSRPTTDFCSDIPALDPDEWMNAQCQKAEPERARPGCLKMLETKVAFCAITR